MLALSLGGVDQSGWQIAVFDRPVSAVLFEPRDAELIAERKDSPSVEVGALRVRHEIETQVPSTPGNVRESAMTHHSRMRASSSNFIHQERRYLFKLTQGIGARQ